jgi:hypothetical protein
MGHAFSWGAGSFVPQLAASKLAAQDDGFARGLRNIRLVVRKTRKMEKVTGSPNDTRGGSGSATNPLKPKEGRLEWATHFLGVGSWVICSSTCRKQVRNIRLVVRKHERWKRSQALLMTRGRIGVRKRTHFLGVGVGSFRKHERWTAWQNFRRDLLRGF